MSVPMIIDTDPGVDDAVALMLAAASPEVQLLAVTTVFGNVGVEITTANALRLRALAELGQLPVAAGAARPLGYPQGQETPGQRTRDQETRGHGTRGHGTRGHGTQFRHGPDGLAGRADLLAQPTGSVDARGAVALMADLLRCAPAPVTLVAIGPLTNIALLLAAHPEVRSQIDRIVIMGGHLGGQPAESNIRSDPEAAHRMLVEEDVPTTLVPLDLTRRAAVDGAWLAELAAAGPRCAALAATVECHRARFRDGSGSDPVPLHDSLAVLEAAVPGTLRTAPMRLKVICDHEHDRGTVLAEYGQHTSGRAVQVALDADLPTINAAILDRLRSLR